MESGSKINRMAEQEQQQNKQIEYSRMEKCRPSEAAIRAFRHKPYDFPEKRNLGDFSTEVSE